MSVLKPDAHPRRRRRAPTGQPMPAYNLADGAGSYRHTLTARERTVLDRAIEIVGRTMIEDRPECAGVAAAKDYLRLQLAGEPVEHFGVLYLDSQHRAIAFERMFSGSLTQTSVYPREVVRAALNHHAVAVILAHNHPGGDVTPSRADEVITRTLKDALALVDVRVLDHIIVAGRDVLSMAERGLM